MRPLRQRLPTYSRMEREALRLAGQFNAELMDYIRPYVIAGAVTQDLDRMIHDYIVGHGHIPACLGYRGFPKSSCISINEVVCHGIPDGIALKEGDIVNVDLTSIVNGWYGDQSETFTIGKVSDEALTVTQVAFDSLYAAINAIKPEGTVYDIGRAIMDYVTPFNFSIVREYQGHGIGRRFHQKPGIPHFPVPESRHDVIMPGVCFTIEPMINVGGWETEVDSRDGWTVRTTDRMLSAQFEHTILMTEDGPEILTMTQNGPRPGHKFVNPT
jgi:methionyl aminopeptidase